MSLIRSCAAGSSGADGYSYLKTISESGARNITITDLQVGKEYIILLVSGWYNASYADNSIVTVSAISNSTDMETIVTPDNVSIYSGAHADYSMYKFKATSTSVVVTRGLDIKTDVVVFEHN